MAKTGFLPPLMFLLLFATFRATLSLSSPNISTDQSALLALKSHVTHDLHNLLVTNWSTSFSVCSWIGVTCGSRHHRVIALDLSSMDLTGTIPSQLGNLSFLALLNICNNSFHGSLPSELTNLHRLKHLNFGNNSFNREIPSWFGYFAQLQSLYLYMNNFSGVIPSFLGNLSKLEWLYLDYNSFSEGYEKKGQPEYMMDVLPNATLNYAGGLSFTAKGLETEFAGLLTIWTAIDFSNNQFLGEIPKTLGELHSLIVLNLSHNSLIGSIPSSLGDLSELESLDLSSNKLHGRIPTELNNLGFLEVLNLSHNHLKGPIPQSKQFDTFTNDSYIGNLDLCGLPLSRGCDNDAETPTKLDRDDDDDDEINWKFSILMGYGCGLVLGLSMAYIVFTTGKPWWFIRIFERARQRLTKR